ncbi:MAG TPA: AmmeMemoRadiSam system protein B [Planctomycetota bacterium]|nr:AmmeMemoRadiSam system protein B [Planctomycetota bacterium]
MDAERPRLRSDLEFASAEAEDGPLLLVHDPQALAVEVVQLSVASLPILERLDGSRTLEDIRLELLNAGAGIVPLEDLRSFVETLDRCCLLEGGRSEAQIKSREDFATAPVRPAAHAGAAYPEEPAETSRFLDGMLALAPSAPETPLLRLIAPHIDLRLGAEVYAHAHRRLQASGRPDVAVVIGVRHAYGTRRFTACRKDFETPLGAVRHDARLLDALEERLGDLTAEQLVHREEHSVEFQALWLAHLWPDDPPPIVPLLAGSFHDLIETRQSPAADPEIESFVAALRDAIAADGRRVLVLASVDLAHVGPMYDQPEGLDEAGEKRLEEADRKLLGHVEAGDAEGFFAAIAEDGNARNVCGVSPVYVALRLGEGRGELLRYGQGRIHPESGSVVSFAALAFAR